MVDKYIEIAKFLGDPVLEEKYKSYKTHLSEGRFLLPVMGQFSSGKSCFINNFLGRDILPTKTTETTSYLTYIAFGEEEKAILVSTEGMEHEIPLTLINEIHEQNSNVLSSKLELPTSFNIKQINVFLSTEFLKNGIVLVDTPGLNTLKSHHEAVTYDILQYADYFMYVVRKSVSEKDLELIKQIEGLGIEVLIIRTHIDEVNESEESVIQLIEYEKELLSKDSLVREFYPISNLKDAGFESFNKNLFERLNKKFGSELKKLLFESIRLRLTSDNEQLVNRILEKEKYRKHIAGLDTQEVKDKIKILTKNIKALELNTNKEKRSSTFEEELSTELNKIIVNLRKKLVVLFAQAIKHGNEPKAVVSKLFGQGTSVLGNWYEERLNEIKITCAKTYKENLDIAFNGNEFPNEEVSFDLHEVEEQSVIIDHLMEEVAEANNRIEDKERCINQNSETINIQETDLQELAIHMNNSDETLANFSNSYEKQYKTVEGKKVSGIFKFIGKGLDIASLIIPAGAAVKSLAVVKDGATAVKTLMAGTKFTKQVVKVGSNINKVTKFTKQVAKVGAGLNKISKGALLTVKKGKPILEEVNKNINTNKKKLNELGVLNNKYDDNELKGLGMLNLLTFEYWGKKAGEYFDEPDKQVIDKDYEEAFQRQKYELINQHEESRKLYLQRQYEIDDTMDEANKLKKSVEFDKKYRAGVELKIQQEKEEFKKRQKDIINKDLCAQFDNTLEGFIQHQKQGLLTQLKIVEDKYLFYATLKLSTQINSMQHELSKQEEYLLSGVRDCEADKVLSKKHLETLNEQTR